MFSTSVDGNDWEKQQGGKKVVANGERLRCDFQEIRELLYHTVLIHSHEYAHLKNDKRRRIFVF